MTRIDLLFGLVSLLPAALNTTPAGHAALTAALCTGDGTVQTIQLPLGGTGIPGREQPGCCAKGCHAGSRKRTGRRLDPSQ